MTPTDRPMPRRALSGAYRSLPSGLQAPTSRAWNEARALVTSLRSRRSTRGPVPLLIPNDTGQPLVSVVIAAYDEQVHLPAALTSVAGQTFGDFECIIVDDESYDHTLDVAMEMVKKDSRFRVLRHRRNAGLSATRNSGLAHACGKYVTFLDGDDFLFSQSLAWRIEQLVDEPDDDVAGVYCDWVPVRHDATLDVETRGPRRLRSVDYLSSGGTPPFIASAPMLRTDVARAAGGFDPDFGSAEDFELWSRIMRLGFRFRYVPNVGVAYRQRRDGMVQGRPADHAAHVDRVMNWQDEDVELPQLGEGAPLPFARARSHYESVARKTERLIGSLALAVAADDSIQIEHVLQLMPDDAGQVSLQALDVARIARRDVKRAQLADASITASRLDDIIDKTVEHVRSLQPDASRTHPRLVRATATVADRTGDAHEVRDVTMRPAYGGRFGGVVLVPLARYHTDELVPLGEALAHLGVRSSFLLTPREGPDIHKELIKTDLQAYGWPGDIRTIGDFDAMVTLNDWGPTVPLADIARRRGALTVAKVEGVQDFDDADTGRERLAYRRSDLVLCQGVNDVASLEGERTAIVGNSRLQAVWAEGERSFESTRTVVINSNFTYNVLTGEKTGWLESVLEACELAGVDPLISQHHADGDLGGSLPIATRPMKWLLKHEADLLISRFSTVPFEAMARGVPFVYHNPHDEQVPTFRTPRGAFASSATVGELAAAIETALAWRGSYRAQSAEFFAEQISIDQSMTPAERSAQAIVDELARRV